MAPDAGQSSFRGGLQHKKHGLSWVQVLIKAGERMVAHGSSQDKM